MSKTSIIIATTSILLLLHRAKSKKTIQTLTRPHTTKLKIGNKLDVTILGLGGASIGDLYIKISNIQAINTLLTAHSNNITYFDTSPWYGVGLSEARFGIALHQKKRTSFILQTKVGRHLVPDRECKNGTKVGWIGGYHFKIRFDYTAAGFQRQMEDSLQRMGLGYIDSTVIHDLEPTVHIVKGKTNGLKEAREHLEVLKSSGFPKLQEMRRDGIISTFGAGMNSNEAGEDATIKRNWNKEYMQALVDLGTSGTETETKNTWVPTRGVDFMLLANMFSLLNFEAHEDGILQLCSDNNIAVVIGGPYSSGILATGADPTNGSIPFYNYCPANDAIRQRCRKIEQICNSYNVSLIAAAIQFPLLHPSVVSVIPGGKNSWEVNSNVDNMNTIIPIEMWYALQKEHLIPPDLKLPSILG